MPQLKENFFENILFKFETYSCDCFEDIEHVIPRAKNISKFKLQLCQNIHSFSGMLQRMV